MKMLYAIALAALLIPLAVSAADASGADDLSLAAVAANQDSEYRHGHGKADPIMTDFQGLTFEFFGKAGKFYNIYSDSLHQVNAGLIPGLVDGHSGTYMNTFGVAFNQLRMQVSLADQQGDLIVQSWEEKYTAAITALASGEANTYNLPSGVTFSTEPYRPHTGRTVKINTGSIEFSVWSTPAGLKDSLNVSQPAYLNFNITLLSAPTGDQVEGIVGESLNRIPYGPGSAEAASIQAGSDGRVPNPNKGTEEAYAVADIFGTDFAFNRFSVSQTKTTRRMLSSSPFEMLKFPYTATSHY